MRTFIGNYTLPPEGTNYVDLPQIRGTLQILWSCLSVLILCTWSIVHPNVPCRMQAKTVRQRFRRAMYRLFSKTGWMLTNLFLPDLVLQMALAEWIAVKHLQSGYEMQADSDSVVWSRSHTHFANMGGFGISFQDVTEEVLHTAHIASSFNWQAWCKAICTAGLNACKNMGEQQEKGQDVFKSIQQSLSQANADDQGWQIDEAISATMASITPDQVRQFLSSLNKDEYAWQTLSSWNEYKYNWRDVTYNLMVLKANLWIPTAAQLLKARELGIITSLPDINADDLSDRDKSNGFIKAIAIGQTCWFIMQFLTRIGNGQSTAQLEITVFASAIFSIAVYAFYWDRPKDPTYTITLKAARRPSSGIELLQMAAKGPAGSDRSTIWISNISSTLAIGRRLDSVLTGLDIFLFGLMSGIGSLHCIAWNYVFPTQADRILWRASSLIMASGFPTVAILAMIGQPLLKLPKPWKPWKTYAVLIYVYLIVTVAILFLVARLIILVEVFRCLGFEPPTVFEATWLNSVPHLG